MWIVLAGERTKLWSRLGSVCMMCPALYVEAGWRQYFLLHLVERDREEEKFFISFAFVTCCSQPGRADR
jgi:hypothetical protein